jgi:hypothetical protein
MQAIEYKDIMTTDGTQPIAPRQEVNTRHNHINHRYNHTTIHMTYKYQADLHSN